MYQNIKWSTFLSVLMVIAAFATYCLTDGDIVSSAGAVNLVAIVAVVVLGAVVILAPATAIAIVFTTITALFTALAIASASVAYITVVDAAIPIVFGIITIALAAGAAILATNYARESGASEPAWAIFLATMQGTNVIFGWPLYMFYFNRQGTANTVAH